MSCPLIRRGPIVPYRWTNFRGAGQRVHPGAGLPPDGGEPPKFFAPKFSLQYVIYNKFNGAHSNYDGAGRNASDNNTLYFLAWLMF